MEILRCSICKSPWHPATGHLISEKTRWCGPCTKSWVKELCGMQHRRWGGYRFYDHAKVPPPAVEKVYIFKVYKLVPGTRCTFMPLEVRESGVNFFEAVTRLGANHPDHHIAAHLKGLWREEGKSHEESTVE